MPETSEDVTNADGKSTSEPHFLADPDVSEAFQQMLDEFSKEIDRGAVLIAAEIVSALKPVDRHSRLPADTFQTCGTASKLT